LNLQIQVLTDKLEVQRDTIHEYEQFQQRSKLKYHHPTTNSPNFYHSHVHQPSSFIHRVCTIYIYISLAGLIEVKEDEVMLLRSVTV
jgi:hypothetical protein